MPSSRVRLASLLGIALGAPLTAEYLQAYLSSTGDLPAMLAGILVFAPLYGGAALLIREIAVRTGRGWTGTLLRGAAFGVAMPGPWRCPGRVCPSGSARTVARSRPPRSSPAASRPR